MPKDIGGLSGPLLIIQQAQPACGREEYQVRNNIHKALAGTSWGQQRETLLMTYKAGRQIDHQLRRTCLESKPT